MKAADELKQTALEFSQAYSRESERGEFLVGWAWPASSDRWTGTESRREAVSYASSVPSAARGGWPSRGIPELLSPLAD